MIFRFSGNMRGGKTLGMTAYGLAMAETTDQPVVSNYYIEHPWLVMHRFSTWRDLQQYRNCIILFDEVNTSFDSRTFKSEEQIQFSHFFQQMGKYGITFMYSAQREHTIEKRIRDQTDYVVECRRLWPSSFIEFEWWDTQRSLEQPAFIGRSILACPELIYPLYNSFEIIESKATNYDYKV